MTDRLDHDPVRRRLLAAAVAASAVGSLPAFGANTMFEKAIPSSGEKIPVIGLGTSNTFDVGGDTAARRALAALLAQFRDAGGRVIDTSPMYGTAEDVTGDLMSQSPGNYWVATKVWTRGAAQGIAQMRRSMELLRVAKIDLMQVHNLVDTATHLATLREWQQQGTVRYLGITHYTRSAYADVERTLRREKVDFLQINYSLAEREAEERILPLALERGVAVLANRPFADGAMFDAVSGRAVPEWAVKELGCASWGQYFLKFIVSHPAVTAAIPATSKSRHLVDNVAAGSGPMPTPAQRERMARDFAA